MRSKQSSGIYLVSLSQWLFTSLTYLYTYNLASKSSITVKEVTLI